MSSKSILSLQKVRNLLLGKGLIIPIILIISLVFLLDLYLSYLEIAENQNLQAQTLANNLDNEVAQINEILTTIAKISGIADEQALPEIISAFEQSETRFDSIYIITSKGIISSNRPNVSPELFNIKPILDLLSQGKTHYIQSSIKNETAIYFFVPAPPNGAIVAKINNSIFEKTTRDGTAFQHDSIINIVNDGTPLVSIENGKVKSNNVTLRGSTPISRLTVETGRLSIKTVSISRTTGWQLNLITPVLVLIQPHVISRGTILVIFIIIAGLLIISIRRQVSREIVNPLLELNTNINALAQGDFGKKASLPIKSARLKEIRELAHSFDQMLDALYVRETALRENEEKFRALIEQSIDAFCLIVDGKLEIANQSFCELFGVDQQQVISKNFQFVDIASPSDREYVQEQMNVLLNGEHHNLRYEFAALNKNGEEIEVDVSSSAINYQGRIALQAILRDVTERKRSQQIEHTQRVLAEALSETASLLNSTLEFDVVLKQILDHVGKVVPHDASHVMLIDEDKETVRILAARGYQGRNVREWFEHISLSIRNTPTLRKMYETAEPIAIPNTSEDPNWVILPETAWIKSYAAAPIRVKGEVIGFLNLNSPIPGFFNQEMAYRLQAFADQAGIALNNARLLQDLKTAYELTLQGWSKALELRDYETEGHALRVVETTIHLARNMGFTEPELTYMRYGALLHDIGKIGIPDAILLKNGPLTDEEWSIMRKHPEYAYEVLSPIPYLRPAIDIPYCHHEKWDGSGYPRGL
ncbi:MAG: HD domain-containing phosphohydrolase, partial [Anaerolineales bacterium]